MDKHLTELPDRMLSVPTVADSLGFSKQTIYTAIHDGSLPAYRWRGRIRVLESDVLALLRPVETSHPQEASDAHRL